MVASKSENSGTIAAKIDAMLCVLGTGGKPFVDPKRLRPWRQEAGVAPPPCCSPRRLCLTSCGAVVYGVLFLPFSLAVLQQTMEQKVRRHPQRPELPAANSQDPTPTCTRLALTAALDPVAQEPLDPLGNGVLSTSSWLASSVFLFSLLLFCVVTLNLFSDELVGANTTGLGIFLSIVVVLIWLQQALTWYYILHRSLFEREPSLLLTARLPGLTSVEDVCGPRLSEKPCGQLGTLALGSQHETVKVSPTTESAPTSPLSRSTARKSIHSVARRTQL